jgi:ribosome-associated protein
MRYPPRTLRPAKPSVAPRPDLTDSRAFALEVAQFLHDRQAEEITLLDISGPLVIADYFVIASARNSRHAQAMANELTFVMKQQGRLRRNAAGTEGASHWVLVDFDDVVVHLFEADSRAFYDLEGLWADAPRVPFEPADRPAPAVGAWSASPYAGLPDLEPVGFDEPEPSDPPPRPGPRDDSRDDSTGNV